MTSSIVIGFATFPPGGGGWRRVIGPSPSSTLDGSITGSQYNIILLQISNLDYFRDIIAIAWKAPNMKKHRLSKSRFISGLQCHKQLWWKVHEPDAVELIPDPALQAVFDQGTRVGESACEQVPGGVLIDFPYNETGKK